METKPIFQNEASRWSASIPARLKERDQWVCSGQDKRPIDPKSGKLARTNDPSTWSSWQIAVEGCLARGLSGIGFVLTENDPYVVVDLDNCLDTDTGELQGWASDILDCFSNTYTEVSRSGSGLHIIGTGLPPGLRKRLWSDGKSGIEVYADKQYIALTGNSLREDMVRDVQEELEWLFAKFPEANNRGSFRVDVAAAALPSNNHSLNDSALLHKMRTAGNYEKFVALYDNGDYSEYPSHSEADLALCGMLAFWTGKDYARMDLLFRRSNLIRKKWDEPRNAEGDTHGTIVLTKALRNCTQTYEPKKKIRASDEVQAMLRDMRAGAITDAWKGRTGSTERKLFIALVSVAETYGKPHEEGVTVARSVRDLAMDAGCSSKTANRNAKRLEERGKIRILKSPHSSVAFTYLLLTASFPHREYGSRESINYGVVSSNRTRRAYTPPVDNHSSTKAITVSTMAPRTIQVMDFIHFSNGPVSLDIICEHLGNGRKSEVKKKYIDRLLAEGLLVEAGELLYDTPPDVDERYEKHLENSNSNAREASHREQVEHEREAWAWYQEER